MIQPAGRTRYRVCLLTASLGFAPFAFADVFESLPYVPPADSVYTVPNYLRVGGLSGKHHDLKLHRYNR